MELQYSLLPEMMVVFDNTPEGVVITDSSCTILYVNDAYEQITGIKKAELIGKPTTQARPGSKVPEVLKTGKPYIGFSRKNGPYEWISNITPIYYKNNIVGALSICTGKSTMADSPKSLTDGTDKARFATQRGQDAKSTFDDIISVASESCKLKAIAKKMAVSDIPILLTGESGVGKEIFAQAIHNASLRRNGPFVPINCAAIPAELLESEMFGYEDASFTGAKKGGKRGLFETADGGTIFLDEIGEMSMYMQAKLLRVLQEKRIRPVGSNVDKGIDIRVIAATNQNLPERIQEGKFRIDMYYRLSAFTLELLPLRQRRDDIVPLARKFLEQENKKHNITFTFSEKAEQMLKDYAWPGNVRELQNVVAASAVLSETDVIGEDVLTKYLTLHPQHSANPNPQKLWDILREAEINAIQSALERHGNTVSGKQAAAKELGISVSTLYNKLKDLTL